jgi:hypothetical protein
MGHRVCFLVSMMASLSAAVLAPWPAAAEEQADDAPLGILKFTGGAALGLATHESGHLAMDLALGSDPYFKKVDFEGIPFFAITYHHDVSRRERYVIASAGFWVQHGLSEWVLTRSPDLRARHAPAAKGFLAFHVGTSVAYAVTAFAHAGPAERDTRGMAEAQRVDERWVGAALLAPAALDAYRYYHPRSRWAPWASRAFKLGFVLLVAR